MGSYLDGFCIKVITRFKRARCTTQKPGSICCRWWFFLCQDAFSRFSDEEQARYKHFLGALTLWVMEEYIYSDGCFGG